jgi:hypothetical protein
MYNFSQERLIPVPRPLRFSKLYFLSREIILIPFALFRTLGSNAQKDSPILVLRLFKVKVLDKDIIGLGRGHR